MAKSTPLAEVEVLGFGTGPSVGGFEEAPVGAFDFAGSDIGGARIGSVIAAARDAGLLDNKTARISGRVSPALLDEAKRRSGIGSDTDLIEFALASVALDDPFAEAFRQARGTVDPDLQLGF